MTIYGAVAYDVTGEPTSDRARRVADRAVASSATDVRTGGRAGVLAALCRLEAATVRTAQIDAEPPRVIDLR